MFCLGRQSKRKKKSHKKHDVARHKKSDKRIDKKDSKLRARSKKSKKRGTVLLPFAFMAMRTQLIFQENPANGTKHREGRQVTSTEENRKNL